jgi:hypothetical protein
MNQHQLQIIDYLREENRVLREQLGGRRVRFNDDQRRRLAAKAKGLGRRLLAEIATHREQRSCRRRKNCASARVVPYPNEQRRRSAYSNVCPGAANFSPAGYSFDNLYYPSGSPAICAFDYPFSGGVLDIFGVLFNVNDAGTTYTVNLFSNGVLPVTGLSYGLNVAEGVKTINDGVGGNGVYLSSFTATPVPEPAKVSYLLVGLAALIFVAGRKSATAA